MLDAANRRILRVLQNDGRITNQELAKKCHISPAACHARFQKLRESGYIKGFKAILDPTLLDLDMVMFVSVKLDTTTNKSFEEFAKAVRSSGEILECHMVAGGFDYLLKVRVRDMEAYRAFLGNTLVTMPGVKETRTYGVMEEVKSTIDLPI